MPRRELITLEAPGSVADEAYRELSNHLVRRGLGTRFRHVLVSSPEMGPEAAETAANLAVTCARSGLRTIVMSTGIPQAALERYFDVEGDSSAVVSGDGVVATHRDLFAQAVEVPEVARLLVLPDADDRAALPFRELLAAAAPIADAVITLAPPVLSSSDTVTLADDTDATLLVVRVGLGAAKVARAATMFEFAGSHLAGVVLYGLSRDDDTTGAVDEVRGRRSPTGMEEDRRSVFDGRRESEASRVDGMSGPGSGGK
jgi:Mrp family chromosome partitioning ATPase